MSYSVTEWTCLDADEGTSLLCLVRHATAEGVMLDDWQDLLQLFFIKTLYGLCYQTDLSSYDNLQDIKILYMIFYDIYDSKSLSPLIKNISISPFLNLIQHNSLQNI